MQRAEAERVARTEALFREVNERIAESASSFESDEADFVCECADPACTDRVEATLGEYEGVRDEATHFLVSPGHVDERFERPVRGRPGLHVVEKFHATAAAIVRRLNPRTT